MAHGCRARQRAARSRQSGRRREHDRAAGQGERPERAPRRAPHARGRAHPRRDPRELTRGQPCRLVPVSNLRMRRAALAVVVLSVLVAGCGPELEVEKALAVTEVKTGWYDAGIVDGKNKLVPSATLKLKNISSE